jgi:hypothetical protein
MTTHIFQLTFTHGQLAWVVALGHFLAPPRWRRLLAQLRYLRQLGIPFRETRRGHGRGHRIRYSFDELMEVAVALYAVGWDVRPQVIARILRRNRSRLRRVYREVLEERPATGLEPPKPGTHGTIVTRPDEARFLCVQNRNSETPGKYKLVLPAPATDLGEIWEMPVAVVEVVDRTTETQIPLTSLVWATAYWAERVPEITPGRKVTETPPLPQRSTHG